MALSRRIAVIGAGGWGTALAVLLAGRATLWVRRPELAKAIHEHGENREYLPGVPVPKSVLLTCDPAEAVHQAGIVLLAGPSQYVRKSAGMLAPYLTPGAILVSAAKGLELESWKRMSEVIAEEIPGSTGRIAVLSGPN
ncbi:MAG: NAD(P)-binding domain-containing protein, partial [Firmicutes bacterium]|nr:NAD(P)-binding domain-containing protein [Bacillota bacterium]